MGLRAADPASDHLSVQAAVDHPIESGGRAGRLLARIPIPLLLLAPAVGVLLIAAVTPEPTRFGFAGDLDVYRVYAVDLLAGLMPYRNVPIEYPPLAIAPMVIPLVGATGGLDPSGYLWRFAAMQAILLVGLGWLVHRLAGRSREALGLWVVLACLSWVAILFRYDIWPVATTVAAVVLADRLRPGAAGLALGLGTMLKLFPAALLPILAAHALVRRDRWAVARLVFGWAAVVAVTQGAAWQVAGPASLDWLRYQAERGLQIESLGASLLMGLHLVAGYPVVAGFGFGSVQLEAAAAPLLASLSPVILGSVLLAAGGLAARRFRIDQARLGRVPASSLGLACLAVLVALLVGSKVLSFQYILWLLPFVPGLPGRMRWLGTAIAGLSTWIYTWDYIGLWHFQPEMILALVVRNALLVWFAGWVLRELWIVHGPRTGRGARAPDAPGRRTLPVA